MVGVLRKKLGFLDRERKEDVFSWVGDNSCIIWLVALLRRLGSAGSFDDQGRATGKLLTERQRWQDHHATLLVVPCENQSGFVAKVELLPVRGSKVQFCFPRGKNGGAG